MDLINEITLPGLYDLFNSSNADDIELALGIVSHEHFTVKFHGMALTVLEYMIRAMKRISCKYYGRPLPYSMGKEMEGDRESLKEVYARISAEISRVSQESSVNPVTMSLEDMNVYNIEPDNLNIEDAL